MRPLSPPHQPSGLPPTPAPSGVGLRLLAGLLALAAGSAAVVVVALLASTVLRAGDASGAGAAPATAAAAAVPVTSGGGATAPANVAFPAPPRGATVLAGRAGQWAVALALSPRPGALGLEAAVLAPDGDGVRGL